MICFNVDPLHMIYYIVILKLETVIFIVAHAMTSSRLSVTPVTDENAALSNTIGNIQSISNMDGEKPAL